MSYYLVFGIGMALSLWASYKVKSTFRKYSQVGARSRMTGAEAAREMLRREGLGNVRVEEVGGFLSDHYDPRDRVLRLSPSVYRGHSLASLGVAAHEAGHALQHAKDYGPLSFRSAMVKPASIGSSIGLYAGMAGLFIHSATLLWVGVLLFSAATLFTLITVPVEFDASRRAIAKLQEHHMLAADEAPGAKKVLDAAALTYVAGAVSSMIQLLYFVMAASGMSSDD